MRIVVADHEGGRVTKIDVASVKLDGVEVEGAKVARTPPTPTLPLAAVAPAGSTTTSRGGTVASAAPRDPDAVFTVTRSAGLNGAVPVMTDTTFEPTGDLDPGLRVLVNDHPVWASVAYQPVALAADPVDAPGHTVAVALDELTRAADPTGESPPRTPGPRPPPGRPEPPARNHRQPRGPTFSPP
jgi:hypothetical protein